MTGFPDTSTLGRNRVEGPRQGFDFLLVLAASLLLMIGLLAVYSESLANPSQQFFKKQLILLGIGVVPFFLFWRIDYRIWNKFSAGLYVFTLAVLASVLLFGKSSHDAQRWINVGPIQFQPSEMAKLFNVLYVASFFANRADKIKELKTYVLSLIYLLPSLILVYKQPHLGATLVLLFSWLTIAILAGVPWRFLVSTVLGLAILLFGAFNTNVMPEYQRVRILAMFKNDEKGTDFQTTQAKIAFASGQVFGTGYTKGPQKQKNIIPEQHNDFIFTVIGEEGGLVGASLVLMGFSFLFFRIWLVIIRTGELYGRLVAGGVLCILAFHTLVNLGMNLSLIPVVGLWLPFMSAGGTALWLCLACIGVLLNISASANNRTF